MRKFSLRLNLPAQIFIALILGIFLGLYLGADSKPLAEIGKLIIQFIKIIAMPLIFFTIVHSILTTDIQLKDAKRLFFFAFFNAFIALGIGLMLSNIFKPGTHLQHLELEGGDVSGFAHLKLDWLQTLKSYFPTSVVSPFAENAVIPAVMMALFIGGGLKIVIRTENFGHLQLDKYFELFLKTTEKILFWILRLIPIAVLFVVAYAVGQYGFKPFQGLLIYVLIAVCGMILHTLVTHQAWILFYVRMPLKKFWNAAMEPVVYALGTNSSLATLPLTLKGLKKLNVSERASSLGACVGTNLNNDGIILYEAMAVLFVAQAHGMDLSFGQQVYTSVLCLIAAIGVAGIPEAGFVSLSIVLTTVGMPVELLPLLLTVDWIVARARSMSNVLSDMMISILIDRSYKRS